MFRASRVHRSSSLGSLRGSQNTINTVVIQGDPFATPLHQGEHPGEGCWCSHPTWILASLLSRNLVLSGWTPVSLFPYLLNEANNSRNLIKWASAREACRLVSSHSKYSVKVHSLLFQVWLCRPELATSPHAHAVPVQVHALRWSQVLLSQPSLSLSTYLTFPCKHRGEDKARDLDSKIAWLFSRSVETPQSSAFPEKNAGRERVWLLISEGGDASLLPQTRDTARVDF